MDRRKSLSHRFWIPMLFVLAGIAACSSSEEQQLLERYFQASRLRDNTTLGNIAAVSFNPRTEGTVQSFDVVQVGQEQRRSLRVRELNQEHQEARAAADDHSKRQKAYQDDNLEAIDRVLKAERANTPLRGRDTEVQAAWNKWRGEMAVHAKKVSDLRSQLSAERSIAELSVMNPRTPVDVTQYDGELISKDVTIRATVRTPENQDVEKTLVVTLQRAELKGAGGDVSGRWIISAIKEEAAPPATS